VINNPGFYQTVCIELELDGLAVNTLLQSHHVHDIEGTSATVAFDNMPQASLEEMMGNNPGPSLASYDETALCSGAFRVLKSMVISWVRDVSVHRNVYADYQLMHLYRFETINVSRLMRSLLNEQQQFLICFCYAIFSDGYAVQILCFMILR